MKRILATAAVTLLLAQGPALAQQDGFGPLLAPDALAAAQQEKDPLLIDIRSEGDFADGHIDGAVNAPYGLFRGPEDNPGKLPTEARAERRS